MRRNRNKAPQRDEPSLVPLADMLTNTVGIMVFILIFTVLTAGGAVIAKRLPMEHTSDKSDYTFICWGNRLYPVPDALIEEFLKPLGKPEKSTSGFREFAAKFRARTVEDRHMKLTGEADVADRIDRVLLDLTIVCTPKDGNGEGVDDLRRPDSRFREVLRGADPNKLFVMFLVRPDSIDVFGAARDVAAEMQFGAGWSPQRPDQPIRLSLTGSGRRPYEQ